MTAVPAPSARMDLVARWFAPAMIAFGLASLGMAGRPVLQFLSVLVLIHAPINLACAAFCLRRGHQPAFFFLASWGFLILGTVLLALSTMGWIASSLLTEHGMQIGSAAEMVLLSFALAYRLNLLREENVALELASRCNLELWVEQRTAALSDAIFGRYGGEEFVLLQRDANGESAAALAERIRADVAALAVGPTGRIRLTVNIGHALSRADDEHWDRTLERADAALHAAKQQGRNRVAAA